ncbi:MAG: amino acid permease [Candidatus Methanoperedens sp.]|nr:amino acid permease [Candidatus Methanoperedens sp.]
MSQKPGLKRELGLFEVTLSGVGIILGAGIYALIGKAAGLAGNSVWMSFAISAVVALFTGLSYSELSSMFPGAGAEHEYIKNAFGKVTAFIIGWLIILSGIIGASTVALGFGGYFSSLFHTPAIPSAIILIVLLSFVLFLGIKESVFFAILFTIIETAGLLFIIVIGVPHLGNVDYFEMPLGVKGLFEASALVFFAYMGFEGIVKLSEETKNPEKTIPKSLILALLISIFLYVLVALASVSVMGWDELATSEAPLADIAFTALGPDAFVILSVIALFATANTALLMMLASSRITYGMAESSSLPSILARIHHTRRTPSAAIFIIMLLSLMFVFSGDIGLVANITNYTLFVTFIVINATVITLRYKLPELERPFRVPLNIGKFPVLALFGFVFCLFMLTQLGMGAILSGIGLTLIGLLFALMYEKYGH